MAVGGFKISLDDTDRAIITDLTSVLARATEELKRYNDGPPVEYVKKVDTLDGLSMLKWPAEGGDVSFSDEVITHQYPGEAFAHRHTDIEQVKKCLRSHGLEISA